MSYFIFGTFRLSHSPNFDTRNQVAFDILGCGLVERLHLLLGHNVYQENVLEMLGLERGRLPNDLLPFVMTDSPVSDGCTSRGREQLLSRA